MMMRMKNLSKISQCFIATCCLGATLWSAQAEVMVNYALNRGVGCSVQEDGCDGGIWAGWGGGNVPAAFDGDLNTSTGTCKTWAGVALMADFKQVRTIEKINVYFDEPGTEYRIWGSDNKSDWTLIRYVSNDKLVDSQMTLNASFRYVKLSFHVFGGDPASGHAMKEIEMWGVGSGSTAILSTKQVAVSPRFVACGTVFSFTFDRPVYDNVVTKVFDLSGKELWQRQEVLAGKSSSSVSLTGLKRGTYLVKISAGNQHFERKAVITQ